VGVVRFVSVSMAAIVFVACVGIGVSVFPASTAAGIAMLTFIVAFTVSMARLPQRSDGAGTPGAGPPSRAPMTISIGFGACASIVMFALLGFCAIAGPASGPIVWAALVVAAIVRWLPWARHRMRGPIVDVVRLDLPSGRNAQAPAASGGTLTDLSTHELCGAWRQSWLVLLDVRHDPTQWVQVAEARRRYLDELERRDPTGFFRWLDSGARAGGNPLKFVTSHVRPRDPRNGDDPPAHPQFAD
jgi:hypothetical protein